MHMKKISKPARAVDAGGFDPAAIITAKATYLNALVNILKLDRIFGCNLGKACDGDS